MSQEYIEDLYFNQLLSQRAIGEILCIGQTSVRRIFTKYGIKARSASEARETPLYKQRRQELSEKYSREYVKERHNVCEWCGKSFSVTCETKKNRFCSAECVSAYKRSKRKKYFCKSCGTEIIFTGDRYYKKIYCDECAKNRPWSSKPKRITLQCGYCGKPIEVIASRAAKNKYCYCDMDCMSKHYAEIYSGENSPAWKGGKGHHYIGNFFHQRNEARKRDNYTCQLCGVTEEEFEKQMSAHHIKPYREFEDKEEANQLDNLVCLCESCHRFVHSNLNVNNIFRSWRTIIKI